MLKNVVTDVDISIERDIIIMVDEIHQAKCVRKIVFSVINMMSYHKQ